MSSITDNPINSISQDLLKIETYSQALSNFIVQSDTPITIGLQGEWGTGKTSLMGILLEDLEKKNIATSWVNTWEYSMFRGSNETTPKILQGMLEKLESSCKEKNSWDIGEEGSHSVKKVGRFLGNIANQVAKNQIGLDIAGAATKNEDEEFSTDIAIIKKEISNIINRLIDSSNNSFNKTVFFVDDLDRIPPADAVEVLEALKNIFDIPNCIFILAIDYDVVVKGLEGKFGPKTEKNEREFRSFFDKIIQVPFSMPVGTYDIDSFLNSKLADLGINVSNDFIEHYSRIVKYTVGTNPRSLKRYLNSYSLINNVRALQASEDTETDDFMLFALLGMQISYPQIFRLLTQDSDYLFWTKAFASKQDINWEDIQEKLTLFEGNELVDEPWEQIIWGICQREAYLRSRTFDVLQLLNFLRSHFGETLQEELDKAMEFAAITSVDDDADAKQATRATGKRMKFGGIDEKTAQLAEMGLNQDGISSYATLIGPLLTQAEEKDYLRVSMAKTGSSFNDDSIPNRADRQQVYIVNPKKRTSGITFGIKQSTGLIDELFDYISSRLKGEGITTDKNTLWIYDPKPTDRYQIRSLQLEYGLSEALGIDKYNELLSYIAQKILRAIDDRHSS